MTLRFQHLIATFHWTAGNYSCHDNRGVLALTLTFDLKGWFDPKFKSCHHLPSFYKCFKMHRVNKKVLTFNVFDILVL